MADSVYYRVAFKSNGNVPITNLLLDEAIQAARDAKSESPNEDFIVEPEEGGAPVFDTSNPKKLS